MTEINHLRRLALLTLTGALWALPAAARESGEPQRFHVVYPGQRAFVEENGNIIVEVGTDAAQSA